MNLFLHAIKNTLLYQIYCKLKLNYTMQRWSHNDQNAFDFYSFFIKPGDTCFDIGANMGNRTKIFLKLGASVVAVEPQNNCIGFLQKFYGSNPNIHFVQKAVGTKEGRAEMMISNEHTLSSLSKEWVKAVRRTRRFSESSWNQTQTVQMTTLDKLIDQYGMPSFIKIDVEGYEFPVLKGLTKPVRALSLEFVPEFIEPLYRCIDYLSSLGEIKLNYSLGESMTFENQEWISPVEMFDALSKYKNDNIFGDLYVIF